MLSATSLCMQLGRRTCTYAELSAAWTTAAAREDAPHAWVAARAAGDEALRRLSAWRRPGGEEHLRFGRDLASTPDPDTTLKYWLVAVDRGYQGSFPWGAILRWRLDTAPPRIHERRATVTTAAGQSTVTRRPRLASGVTTERWALAHTHPPAQPRLRPTPEQGQLFPLTPPMEHLAAVSPDRPNPALRGDTTLLLDVAHMADRPVRGTVREWAGLLARTRTGGFRHPQASDYRRVWDAALAARSMHLRERDTQGRLTGRWAPLVHVDTAWSTSAPAGPLRRRNNHRPRPVDARRDEKYGRMDADRRRRGTRDGADNDG